MGIMGGEENRRAKVFELEISRKRKCCFEEREAVDYALLRQIRYNWI